MTNLHSLYILVTDLNHHVRNLLQRELAKSGHVIYTACNKKEAHEALLKIDYLDLIILDPQVSEILGESFLKQFREKMPKVNIIFHTFIEFFPDIEMKEGIWFVEKNEKSILFLKKIVHEHARKMG
ncbi:MAG: response regulator [Desulfamplus sp.]|nr:response regulator [Desulfamplus sp.]